MLVIKSVSSKTEICEIGKNDKSWNEGNRNSSLGWVYFNPAHMPTAGSVACVPLLTPTCAWTRDPLHTSTTATLEASLPIAPQKPRPLQSKGNNYFKVSERVTSPIETLLARTPPTS
jgi:hypothetical protein